MARAVWTGAITFGLVSVPVRLFSATQDHDIHFNQFQRGTSDRIRYKRVNERTGEEVDFSEIVKGRDIGGGTHVLLEPDELEAIAPGRSRALDITAFVDLDDIDPIFFQKTYYLAPASEDNARVYALLREAMAATHRAGIATFVMRGREYLAAIRAEDGVLTLETMYFADEIRTPRQELGTLPGESSFPSQELSMAKALISSMETTWRPEDYRDTYTERVEQLIDAKRKGEEVVGEAEPPQPTNVVDLMEVLRASVEAAADRRRDGARQPATSTATGARRKAPGKGKRAS
jgi:DNA end-binding protein Ku